MKEKTSINRNEISTDELSKQLQSTHVQNIEEYLRKNKESMIPEERPFAAYMKELIHAKQMRQQDIFLWADIPERYGYKLLSEEKHTRQRDVILRICYAANFTLAQTQKALRIYGMPELYAKIPRDAVLMIAFNERPGSILEVNLLLKQHGYEMLRTSGSQE